MKCELRLVVSDDLEVEHCSWKAWYPEAPRTMIVHVRSARQAAALPLKSVVVDAVVEAFAMLEAAGCQLELPLAPPVAAVPVTPHCLTGEEALFEEF